MREAGVCRQELERLRQQLLEELGECQILFPEFDKRTEWELAELADVWTRTLADVWSFDGDWQLLSEAFMEHRSSARKFPLICDIKPKLAMGKSKARRCREELKRLKDRLTERKEQGDDNDRKD